MNDIIHDFYEEELTSKGFIPKPDDHTYCSVGKTWQLSEEIGSGIYWIYHHENMFDIKIHDFCLHNDTILTFDMPKCLSITRYESISGEELSPYRRLEAGSVQTFIGGGKPCKILVHKKIPIRAIGIEIMPAYYEKYLKERFKSDYVNPFEGFVAVDKTFHFPEMSKLLFSVMTYRGEGMSAKLFYESKVAQAVGLIVDFHKTKNLQINQLSASDIEQIETITQYLNDHYAKENPLDQLAKIACMSRTKLQSAFKKYHHQTITAYIQQRRMYQAEYMLFETDIPIHLIAESIGYKKASRFTELFKKRTGLLPNEYRKMARNK